MAKKKSKKLTKKQIAINKRERHKKSKSYLKKRAQIDYKNALAKWSKEVRTRDNFVCQLCFRDCKKLGILSNAHHILDKKNWKEYSLEVNNGITLCFRCHKCNGFGPHMNSIWFAEWLRINKPEIYKYILILMENKKIG